MQRQVYFCSCKVWKGVTRFCSDRIASLLGWCKTCRKCAVMQRRPVTLKLLLPISAINPELRLHNSVPAKCVLAATNVHLAATAWCFIAAKMGEFCSNKVSFVATKLPLDFAASRLKPSKCCTCKSDMWLPSLEFALLLLQTCVNAKTGERLHDSLW